MEKYFSAATFGTLVVFALALYLIMYLTKPAAAAGSVTVSAQPTA